MPYCAASPRQRAQYADFDGAAAAAAAREQADRQDEDEGDAEYPFHFHSSIKFFTKDGEHRNASILSYIITSLYYLGSLIHH